MNRKNQAALALMEQTAKAARRRNLRRQCSQSRRLPMLRRLGLHLARLLVLLAALLMVLAEMLAA